MLNMQPLIYEQNFSKLPDDGDPWAPNNLLKPGAKEKTPIETQQQATDKNVTAHHYNLESTFILRDIRSDLIFYSIVDEIPLNKQHIAPNGTPRFTSSQLVLYCLPTPHKKETRL